MEEKLEKILLDLNIGYITVKVAKRKILRLFAVSGSFCIKHGCKKECIECENDTFPMGKQNDH